LRELWLGLVDLLLPPACAACGGAADELLCARCAARLPRIPIGNCTLCQEREADAGDPWPRCLACLRRRGPLQACIAGCWFEGEAAGWIRAFKYPGPQRGLAADPRARLHALALETLARAPAATAVAAVVPVPLHPHRLRSRGFNPALTLARQIARTRGLRLRPGVLERIRDTPSQTGLTRVARRRNVRGAFRARRRLRGTLWLVDDVVTTGATLVEAARALRRAGASRVVALCAARTPTPGAS
jgi:predicted amidophosphoribosyltransferase